MSVVESIIDGILKREGGYVDHQADRGGPTNMGITQATLAEYRGHPVTEEEVQSLTAEEARAIYRKRYVFGPGFQYVVDTPLLELLVDTAVLMGPKRAVMFLQAALGVVVDGVIGPNTRDVLEHTVNLQKIYAKVLAARIRAHGRDISANAAQHIFAAGWLARASEFVEKIC